MFLPTNEGGRVPGSLEMRQLREILSCEALKALTGDDVLMRTVGERGGLLEAVNRVVPDLSRQEQEWFAAIPARQLEAIRAVVFEVAADPSADLELDVQYEPAYDFGVSIYEFDKTVVVRVKGPYPGQTYARDAFSASRER